MRTDRRLVADCRWFAAAYILVAVCVIINLVGQLYEELGQLIAFASRRSIGWMLRLCSVDVSAWGMGSGSRRKGWTTNLYPAWRFYSEQEVPVSKRCAKLC